MEYLPTQRNKVLIPATTRLKLENVTLGERSQSQKMTWFHLYEMSGTCKATDRKRVGDSQGLAGMGTKEAAAKQHWFFLR